LKTLPKYTTLKRRDGLGGQLRTLSILVDFAEQHGMNAICDLRQFSYFRKDNKSFLRDRNPADLIEFHPSLIYGLDQIDSIPSEEILDWRNGGFLHILIEWATGDSALKKYPEDFEFGEYPLYESARNLMSETWRSVVDSRDASSNKLVKVKMPIRIKDRSLIEGYKIKVRNSVTVHARLGNGEQETMKRAPKRALKRMAVDRGKFITEMKKHGDSQFFICTDTLSFLNECKDVFGDRVFSIDRDWPPAGWGPLHNISDQDYPEDIKRQWRSARIDPWKLLCTDLIDMELMCESKHIICNESQFNYFARFTQKCTIIK